MKISAFQIKNYRSIVDSKKCFLSPDYITALIGQNESGKTSVLEALRSFFEGYISDDVLRSDLTFPEITCTFVLDETKCLADYINIDKLPPALHTVVRELKEVAITRRWLNAKQNVVIISEEKIFDFYNDLENNKISSSNKIITSILQLEKSIESADTELAIAESELSALRSEVNNAHAKIEDLLKTINRSKSHDIEIIAKQDLENARQQMSDLDDNFRLKLIALDEKRGARNLLAEKLQVCKSFNELNFTIQSVQDEIKINNSRLHDTELQYKLCKSDREARNIGKRLEQLREKQSSLINDLNRSRDQQARSRIIADRILDGKKRMDAEKEAAEEFETEKGFLSLDEIGMNVFKYIPVFEFFEDFSSLLPNKIDLDDLLNENSQVEGYKAARNFLSVAGLNADFFREENHRILKQKIENLNSEITIDFQDYWRQSVGKDDKIRINFELEHYDNSQPEKSGKPYLEFWVKDKQERLYPKQRSRGVRWFLSFYLELKATAKENTIDRVMLIDEPGLSLHARAQEDVLKVFEDLRENLQIIYCTHSPNLIDIKRLYRIIAVQRARESDEKSETVILDSRTLNEASADTLSPIYALMGTRLNDRQFIFPDNNYIVEDSVTFHYLQAMSKVYDFGKPIHFIPASSGEQVPLLTNLLFGWKVDFGVILSDNRINQELMQFLKETTFCNHENGYIEKLIVMPGFDTIEDLFSTIDFKRFILKQRVGITVKNSEFIETNKLSRMILVSDFLTKLSNENIQFKDFDEETRGNFERIFSMFPLK